jgi:predicted nucleic acid-binding protein
VVRAGEGICRTWVRERTDAELCTTAVTVAEIRYSIARLPPGPTEARLTAIADEVFRGFQEQVFPFDANAALRYAAIVSERERVGRPIDGFDAQIASICAERRAALATRNGVDFEHTGVTVIDPWRAQR